MARPTKSGLAYFPLDTKFDDKVELCIAMFNSQRPNASRAIVIGVLIELLQAIYFDSFYTDWSDDKSLLYACKCGVSYDEFTFILNAFIDKGIFDKEAFKKYHILTSVGIQKRYFEAVGRRKNADLQNEYLLISIPQKNINVDNNGVFVDNNGVNVCNNATNKIKENKSKIKESKINKTIINKFMSCLSRKTNPTTFGAWLENIKIIDVSEDSLLISVDNQVTLNVINNNYMDLLVESAQEVFNVSEVELCI